MFTRIAYPVIFSAVVTASAMAQASCPGGLPLVSPLNVAVGATIDLTPVDQNCVAIPNDPNNVITMLFASGLASWALNPTGPGVKITGLIAGAIPNVTIQWKDQYPASVHAAVKSSTFTINVTAPPPTVTAVGSMLP